VAATNEAGRAAGFTTYHQSVDIAAPGDTQRLLSHRGTRSSQGTSFAAPFIAGLAAMLKSAFPFALSTLFLSIYNDIDMVMLSLMKGDVMTGWYEVARKFLMAFTFIPMSMREASLPAMAKSSKETPAELLASLTQSCKALWMIALPIAGGMFVLADRLVPLLFGSSYQEAIPAVRVLVCSIPFTFLNGVLWAALVGMGRERQVAAYFGLSALINVLTNLIAIPRFGHVGAAATTVLSYAVVFFLQVRKLGSALPRFSLVGQMFKPLGATASMMCFAWLSRASALLYTVLGSAAVYLGCLIASRAVGRKEWEFVNSVMRGRAG